MHYIYPGDKEAEQYMYCVVGQRDLIYGSILLAIYNDGFLTSAGFFDELLVPEEPVNINDSEDIILMHAVAALDIPINFHNRKFIFANEKEILEQADEYLAVSLAMKEDTSKVVSSLSSIDTDKAFKIANDEHPEVLSPETRDEYRVFIDKDGGRYSWCLMLP